MHLGDKSTAAALCIATFTLLRCLSSTIKEPFMVFSLFNLKILPESRIFDHRSSIPTNWDSLSLFEFMPNVKLELIFALFHSSQVSN